MAMAKVQTIAGDWITLEPAQVFRDFMDGESMEHLSLAHNVYRYVIEQLVREECRRRDRGN